jgi:hypothetical protein
MKRKKVQFTVYISPQQYLKLLHLNQTTKVPMSVFARLGIDIAIKRFNKKSQQNAATETQNFVDIEALSQ